MIVCVLSTACSKEEITPNRGIGDKGQTEQGHTQTSQTTGG